MFPNVKLQRLCKPHNLQCITSSKDSEKLEKSLCERNKAEDLCWIPMAFGHSDDTASLIGMILSFAKWAQEYFLKPLSVNTIHRAICRCQRKLYHAKRSHMWTSYLHVLWAKAHLKWTVSKWKVFHGQTSPDLTFLLEITGAVSSGLPACYQPSVQKLASLMLWGCVSLYGMGMLHVLKGTERYINVNIYLSIYLFWLLKLVNVSVRFQLSRWKSTQKLYSSESKDTQWKCYSIKSTSIWPKTYLSKSKKYCFKLYSIIKKVDALFCSDRHTKVWLKGEN